MSLGQRIRHLRQSRGLTQSELGGRELSKSFISLLEKGRARPSLNTLVLLARRLGASVDSLLGHGGDVSEAVSNGLLVLSREAIRVQQLDRASQLLAMAKFVGEGLDEVQREAQLQDAELALERRAFQEARQALQDAAASNERAADHWRLGRARVLMGWLLLRQRDFPQAERVLKQALSTLRGARAGRDPARVGALIALGGTLIYLGRYSAAIRRYEDAARSEAARYDPKLRAHALWGLGLAHRKTGDHAAARTHLQAAREVLEAMEEVPDYVRVLKAIGQLDYELGNAKDALRHLHHALRAAERLKMRVIHASTLTEIARVSASLGNDDEAEHFARRALTAATDVDDPVEVAEAAWILARIAAKRKDHTAAVRLYKDALAAFTQRQMGAKGAEVARELGLLLRERGAHAQAASYLALSLEQGGDAGEDAEPAVVEDV